MFSLTDGRTYMAQPAGRAPWRAYRRTGYYAPICINSQRVHESVLTACRLSQAGPGPCHASQEVPARFICIRKAGNIDDRFLAI